ncbi:MAG: ADOP family duplicated permease [Vicinamibacterales bacterium]
MTAARSPIAPNGRAHAAAKQPTVLFDVAQDIRSALRTMRASLGLTAAVVVTLGLAIGGTTAAFSVVDALFLRGPEGVEDPASVRRLLLVRDDGSMQTPSGGPGIWNDYTAIRGRVTAFSGVAAYVAPEPVNLGRGPDAAKAHASLVSHDFLDVLGMRPAIGRSFGPADDTASAPPVAVISHRLWRKRFGSATGARGEVLLINRQPVTIIGVTSRGFLGMGPEAVDVWLPSSLGQTLGLMGDGWRAGTLAVNLVARLQPGAVEEAAIGHATQALTQAAIAGTSLDTTPHLRTTPVYAGAVGTAGSVTRSLIAAGSLSKWLMVVSILTLAVACANVTSLLLARNVSRRRETAIRVSLGAAPARVIRQYLTEHLMLALVGWVLGVAIAYWMLGLMGRFLLPETAPRADARVVLFAAGASLLAGLAAGVLPAVRAGRLDPAASLRDARGVGSLSHNRARLALVVVQMAVSLALLVGTGLFVRSVANVTAIDAGVDVERLVVASVDLQEAGYPPDVREAFYDRALQQVAALPGADRAAVVHFPPLSGGSRPAAWRVVGSPDRMGIASLNLVGPGYFETAGTRVLRGRSVLASDTQRTAAVAVVNEAAAMEMADDGSVVGRCIPIRRQIRSGGCTIIVGVVETQRRSYLNDEPTSMIFIARAQGPNVIPTGSPALLIRTAGDPEDLLAAVRGSLQGLAPDLPYVEVRSLAATLEADIAPFRLGVRLFSAFGVLSMTLAAIGLYGVLAYFVSERTPEIGIRRALGARRGAIVALVVRQTFGPVVAGLLVGVAGAWIGARYLASLVFGIAPHDLPSFVGAVAVLLGIALVAMLVPVWRAVRVDPRMALDRGGG